MAKSLRSKSMRKNRSLLRKNVSEPIAIKRQEKLAEEMKKISQDRNGSTILGLKSVFAVNVENLPELKTDVAMDEDIEPSIAPPKMSVNEKFKAKKGSKARNNPKKELVWFK